MNFLSFWIRDLKQQKLFSAVVLWTLRRQGSLSSDVWIIQVLFDEWMKEGGKEGGKEKRKEEKEERNKGGGGGGCWCSWHRVKALAEVVGLGVEGRRGHWPGRKVPVSRWRCFCNLPPLIFSSVHVSPQFHAWCVSLPLKSFSSLPHLNGLQLNAQMYSSSLVGKEIFWKLWQLSITTWRNWRKGERATKEALNRIF